MESFDLEKHSKNRFVGGKVAGSFGNRKIHPGRLTWTIIMEVWKIIFLSKWVICRFHVNLPGCTLKVMSPSSRTNLCFYPRNGRIFWPTCKYLQYTTCKVLTEIWSVWIMDDRGSLSPGSVTVTRVEPHCFVSLPKCIVSPWFMKLRPKNRRIVVRYPRKERCQSLWKSKILTWGRPSSRVDMTCFIHKLSAESGLFAALIHP